MVRFLSYGSEVAAQLKAFATSQEELGDKYVVGHGLIIGQRVALGDDVLYLARTPSETDDHDSYDALRCLDIEWMQEHARNTLRMLPGGLTLLGLFLVDEDPTSDSVKSSVETLLASIRRILDGDRLALAPPVSANGNDKRQDLYVINFDSKSHKLEAFSVTAKASDGVIAVSSGWKRIEWKSRDSTLPYHVIKANYVLDYWATFGVEDTNLPLKAKMDKVLKIVAKNLRNAIILFDPLTGRPQGSDEGGPWLHPDMRGWEPPRASSKGGSGKKSQKSSQPIAENNTSAEELAGARVYQAEILFGCLDDNDDEGSEDTGEVVHSIVGSHLKLAGKMGVRAYPHPWSTLEEAAEAVKEDIWRSLCSRLDMHCDSLVGDETCGTDHPEVPVVHEPPRRNLVALPGSFAVEENFIAASIPEASLTISDFLFPGETAYDSVESVHEIFGFSPSLESMDDELERIMVGDVTETVKSQKKLGTTEANGSSRPSAAAVGADLIASRKKQWSVFLFVVLSVAVAVAAVIIVSFIRASDSTPKGDSGGSNA